MSLRFTSFRNLSHIERLVVTLHTTAINFQFDANYLAFVMEKGCIFSKVESEYL